MALVMGGVISACPVHASCRGVVRVCVTSGFGVAVLLHFISGFGVWGLKFGVWGLGFGGLGVWGLKFGGLGAWGFGAWRLGCGVRVWGLGFWGVEFWV